MDTVVGEIRYIPDRGQGKVSGGDRHGCGRGVTSTGERGRIAGWDNGREK